MFSQDYFWFSLNELELTEAMARKLSKTWETRWYWKSERLKIKHCPLKKLNYKNYNEGPFRTSTSLFESIGKPRIGVMEYIKKAVAEETRFRIQIWNCLNKAEWKWPKAIVTLGMFWKLSSFKSYFQIWI